MLPYVKPTPHIERGILMTWQNEYAQILQKRLGQAKAAHDEARKRRASSMRH
jgi:hypothetical protein